MTDSQRKIAKKFGIAVVVFVVYVIAGKLGLRLAFVNASATAVWPPTGIALAMLLFLGYEYWPVILLGAFFVNFTTAGSTVTSIGIAIGNTLEAVLGAYLVNRFAFGRRAFDTPWNIFGFAVLAGFVATAVSASIGVATLVLGHLTTTAAAPQVWFTWWLGDMGGALIIAPFLILWSQGHFFKWTKEKIFEAIIFLVVFIGIGAVVFNGVTLLGSKNNPLDFLFIPLMLWVIFRFSRREVSAAILILASQAVWGTLHGFGPFVRPNPNDSLLFLQSFLIVASIGSQIVAALIGVGEKLEVRFRELIENSSDAISLIDKQTKILYASPSTKRVLGFKPEEFVGTNGLDLVHPSDKVKIVELLSGLLASPGKTITFQTRVKRKDGSFIWTEANVTNLLGDPSVGALVVNYRDITESKQAQDNLIAYSQDLAEEKARAEALIASIGEGIIATDNTGKILLANKAFEDSLGWKISEIINKNDDEIMAMEDEGGTPILPANRPLHLALAGGKKITAMHYLVRKNKTKFPAAITATPLMLNGKIIGVIKVLRDVTVEVQIDRAKTEFVSLASHQLRTPLTIIKWHSARLKDQMHLLKDQPELEICKKYLQSIYLTNQRMIELVNAILNVSKIDLGTLAIEPHPTSLAEITERLLEELEPEIKLKKLKVTKVYPSKLPFLNIDPKLMRIVLQNLLTNSIKYTPPGGRIAVKLELGKTEMLLTVSDTGCGIAPEDYDKLFSKFFRTNAARQIDPSGNGLGMYIVKAILDQTKGKISFESKLGKGTTFYVTLPLAGMSKKEGIKDLTESVS